MVRLCRRVFIDPLSWLNRDPILFSSTSFHLVYFGLFAAVETFLTASILLYYVDAKGHDFRWPAVGILGVAMVGDILGVKLAHAIVVGWRFFERPGKYLNQTTMYNQGGMLGVFASLIALSIIERVELAVILDAVTYGAVLGLVVGRLGCYNYGCCYGKPTKSGCHVCYSNPNAKVLRLNPGMKNVPLIPTQIYCSYANLILFVLFTGIAKSLPYDGLITLLFIILYNGFRIAIQRYRAGTRRTDGATVAFVILVVLAGFFVSYSYVTGSFLVRRPFQHPLSLYGYFRFIVSDRSSLGSALLVSLVAFLFYGVHGKTLGKHTGS